MQKSDFSLPGGGGGGGGDTDRCGCRVNSILSDI